MTSTTDPAAAGLMNPFKELLSNEALVGELTGAYSRRINIQLRFVDQVLEDVKVVKVLRMWTHCGN